MNSIFYRTALFLGLSALCSITTAAPIYLNQDNITVAIGSGSTYTTANNTFSGGQTINKVIDAPSADATEFHNQTTHLWFSGGVLELLFDFQNQYDLSTLHFWNYTGEAYDVDNILFTFFDGSNTQVGDIALQPALGSNPGILAEDIVLAAPLNVRYVTAVLSGTNNQIDFQNMGFTASLSTDRCEENPNDPVCQPITVPVSGTLFLVSLGLFGMRFRLRR